MIPTILAYLTAVWLEMFPGMQFLWFALSPDFTSILSTLKLLTHGAIVEVSCNQLSLCHTTSFLLQRYLHLGSMPSLMPDALREANKRVASISKQADEASLAPK